MLFWAVIAVTAALVALTLGLSFRHGADQAPGAQDVALYRDQLAEVDRDAARGVLDGDEAGRVRIEVQRRLLDADRAARTAAAARRGPLAPAVLIAVLIAGSSLALYQRLGAPGYPDMPRQARLEAAAKRKADRPRQAEAETRFGTPWSAPAAADPKWLDLVAQLRAAVAARPGDRTGWELLAKNEAELGNYAGAATAQAHVVALKGSAAAADDQATLASFLVTAAGGFVSPEAETALARALKADPKNGTARYYTGLLYAQTGRPDLAFRLWRPLLDDGPADAPWMTAVRAQIGLVAEAAGIRYELPADLPGPSAADVAAAGQMSDADRQTMIRGMVDGLATRLADQGGPASDWARLIAALGVLGESDRARAIYAEAAQTFAADPAGLAAVRAAAAQAGVGE